MKKLVIILCEILWFLIFNLILVLIKYQGIILGGIPSAILFSLYQGIGVLIGVVIYKKWNKATAKRKATKSAETENK